MTERVKVKLLVLSVLALASLPATAHADGGVTHGEALVDGRLVEVPASAPAPPPPRTATRAAMLPTWQATGPRDVVVIPVRLNGAAANSATALRSTFFDGPASASAWFQELTGGTVSLRGDVVDPVTITASANCAWESWGAQAETAVTARGTALSAYDNVVYVFSGTTGCGWSGLAYMPGNESYFNATTDLGVVVHELGHNFGLDHAAVWDCYDAGGKRVALSASCQLDEYGDPFDAMGTGSRLYSAPHRAQGGWLPAGSVATASGDGSYRLASVTDTGSAPRMLRIPRPDGTVLTLELRSRYGAFDAFATSAAVVNGISLRIHDERRRVQTRLIDTTPATWSVADAPLAVGASLTDPATGRTITLERIDALGATVAMESAKPAAEPVSDPVVAPQPDPVPDPGPATVPDPPAVAPPPAADPPAADPQDSAGFLILPDAQRAAKPPRKAKAKAKKKKRAKGSSTRRRSQSRRTPSRAARARQGSVPAR